MAMYYSSTEIRRMEREQRRTEARAAIKRLEGELRAPTSHYLTQQEDHAHKKDLRQQIEDQRRELRWLEKRLNSADRAVAGRGS